MSKNVMAKGAIFIFECKNQNEFHNCELYNFFMKLKTFLWLVYMLAAKAGANCKINF